MQEGKCCPTHPMWIVLNGLVEIVSWALGVASLPVPVQLVGARNVPEGHCAVCQQHVGVLGNLLRVVVCEVPDEVHAVADRVEAEGVGTHDAPAPALIDHAVSTNQEAVANVAPVVGVHVVVLDAPNLSGTVVKVEALSPSTVVDEQVGDGWSQVGNAIGRPGTPILSGDDGWALYKIYVCQSFKL